MRVTILKMKNNRTQVETLTTNPHQRATKTKQIEAPRTTIMTVLIKTKATEISIKTMTLNHPPSPIEIRIRIRLESQEFHRNLRSNIKMMKT